MAAPYPKTRRGPFLYAPAPSTTQHRKPTWQRNCLSSTSTPSPLRVTLSSSSPRASRIRPGTSFSSGPTVRHVSPPYIRHSSHNIVTGGSRVIVRLANSLGSIGSPLVTHRSRSEARSTAITTVTPDDPHNTPLGWRSQAIVALATACSYWPRRELCALLQAQSARRTHNILIIDLHPVLTRQREEVRDRARPCDLLDILIHALPVFPLTCARKTSIVCV